MRHSLGFAIALALAAPALLLPGASQAGDRTLPMRFDLRLQGPADACGAKCPALISASGAITADSARDFLDLAQGRDLSNAIVVLDSDGGSVLGAIALGREIRRLALTTTVGHTTDIAGNGRRRPRALLSPQADCESMCAFVLLGGLHRIVPPQSRVMVHQIWLGDRRDDPTAANYSAEDLVLVQRDIGRLAQYTAEMGASVDLLDLALRIPPWEPMHAMTRDELRHTKLVTEEADAPAAATVAAAPPAVAAPVPPATDGLSNGLRSDVKADWQATRISERRWSMIDRAGSAALARHHPLTVEGEDIGNFDLVVACGAGTASYAVSYVERRHAGDSVPLPAGVGTVTLRIGGTSAALKVASSQSGSEQGELVTYAVGTLSSSLIGSFASAGNHSMVIGTEAGAMVTTIRLGNTGAQINLPRLTASCGKASGDRADLAPLKKTGGMAAAQ
jgi:hypothetical protein